MMWQKIINKSVNAVFIIASPCCSLFCYIYIGICEYTSKNVMNIPIFAANMQIKDWFYLSVVNGGRKCVFRIPGLL